MGICSAKLKPVSPIRKIILPSKTSSNIKTLLTKFTKEETIMLQLLFADLSRRYNKETINKDTFSSIFYLPGLLGERLFGYFDMKKTHQIDFECFLSGIANYCKGQSDRKARVIFELCDSKDDLVLDAKEMQIVVALLGLEVLDKSDMSSDVSDKPIKIKKRSKTAPKSLNMYHEELSVYEQVNSLIKTFGNGEALTFTQFQEFVKSVPSFVVVFDKCFNEQLWNNEFLEDTITSSPRKSLSHSQISGELYMKFGDKLISKYGILQDKVLLLYENINSKYPAEVVYMEGCYAEIIGDYYISNKFGISITHQCQNFGEILLWSDSRKERDDWLRFLEYASKVRKFKEFYTLGEKIGHGKFSDVYVCTEHATYKKWAVKVIAKSKLTALERDLLQGEISILKILDHPGVIKTKEIFDSKKHILIIMELVEGGELFDRIVKKKVFSEYSASKIVKQLLEATAYLHDLGIVHRDIKPENILLTDNSDIPFVKVADFGLSKLAGPNDIQNLACGTLGYVAPEVLSQTGYNHKVDVWSVGIIAYLLLRGRLPFDHKEKQILIDLTLRGSLSFEEPYWKSFTPFAIDFLTKIIKRNSDDRLSSREALKHNWIKNADILIPRAIDKKKMEEMNIEKGVSSTNFGQIQYREIALNIENPIGTIYEVQSMPELYGSDCSNGKIN
ncbi:hypothetical protein SteCoe_5198 [Stentor coeruleus]|uniref:non-specific serine/threonine protein kinase n=1 Tax=Stentor coeruleus TaxID=5963 RepID=A0A1R2CT12_9CILI|nr:hypothetical protein SteCoe_5198 [Stentor coeruleus]